jgi:hypothetical protein
MPSSTEKSCWRSATASGVFEASLEDEDENGLQCNVAVDADADAVD